MFPFYVRYALISDGEKAAENSFALDPTVRRPPTALPTAHTGKIFPCCSS